LARHAASWPSATLKMLPSAGVRGGSAPLGADRVLAPLLDALWQSPLGPSTTSPIKVEGTRWDLCRGRGKRRPRNKRSQSGGR